MMELLLEAKRRWEALEEQCRESGGQPEPGEDEPTDMTPDQQQVAAAAEMVNSWERIGSLYVDLQGNAYDEQAAWDRALEIVRSGEHASVAEHAEAGGSSVAAMPVEEAGEEFSPQELTVFVDRMRRGLDLLATRLEAHAKIEAEIANSAR